MSRESSASRPRVLVTREEPTPLSEAVRQAGGTAVELPLLVTRWLPFEIPGGRELDDFDWVAFTSARAVQAVFADARRRHAAWPPAATSAAVGARTAQELEACGWTPQCTATEHNARGLVASLCQRDVRGQRILFPCSAIAEETFPAGMRQAGALVDLLPTYTTEAPWRREPALKTTLAERLLKALQRGCVATCASPSAVRALHELAETADALDLLERTPIVAIGPTTARALDALHLQWIDAGGHGLEELARRAVAVGGSA